MGLVLWPPRPPPGEPLGAPLAAIKGRPPNSLRPRQRLVSVDMKTNRLPWKLGIWFRV